MKWIQLSLHLTDDLGIKNVVIDYNDTGLESNSELVRLIAVTLLKSLKLNKDTLAVQDLLNELGIKTSNQK